MDQQVYAELEFARQQRDERFHQAFEWENEVKRLESLIENKSRPPIHLGYRAYAEQDDVNDFDQRTNGW